MFQAPAASTIQEGYENIIRKYDRVYTPQGTFLVDRVETTSDINIVDAVYGVACHLLARIKNIIIWLLEDDADTIGKASGTPTHRA